MVAVFEVVLRSLKRGRLVDALQRCASAAGSFGQTTAALLLVCTCTLQLSADSALAQSASNRQDVVSEPESIVRASVDAGAIAQERASIKSGAGKVLHTKLKFVDEDSALTLVSDAQFSAIGDRLITEISRVHGHYENLFGQVPSFAVTLRLMEEEEFFLSTGAPRWTNALFYRGQILIPLVAGATQEFSAIARSVRHEYTHAVIHALSEGKTPGWIDEGMAQLAEGRENPALRRALLNYLQDSRPVPFRLMQSGFTRLEAEMVAPAYAQSLIASEALLETFGFERLSDYFTALRQGEDHPRAFSKAFGITEAVFEARLEKKLVQWVNRHARQKGHMNDERLIETQRKPNALTPVWEEAPREVRASR